MIKPTVSVEEWANRYDIDLDPYECPNCNKKIPWTVPVAIKGYRGVSSEDHGCGDRFTGFRCVAVGDKIKFWERFRNVFG